MLDKKIYVSGIIHDTIVDGLGIRTTIYMSGCNHFCNGCHNKETWVEENGELLSLSYVIDELEKDPDDYGITLSGGDPFYNVSNLLHLLIAIKEKFPKKNIWVYTGYKIEQLDSEIQLKCLNYIDVLIDGKFEIDKFDPRLSFRGSSNQRIIKVKDYLENNEDYLLKI